MVDKDIDFAAQLDALDEQDEQPSYVSPDVAPMDFELPGSTRKLIDDSVGAREDERQRQDAIDKARGILDKYKEKFQQDKAAKFGPQQPSVAPENDFWGGEFLRSFGRAGVGTSDMVGGSMRQTATSLRLQGGAENEVFASGLETKGQELSDQAERLTRQVPAARVDDYTKIRTESISSFARDVNDYVQQGLGQVLGYYGPMYVGYKVMGLPGLFLSSAALSVGEVRQTLEEAGVTDPKLLESYGWTAGMTVAALDAIVPGEILTAPVKKGLQKYALTRIATATSKMGLKEAVTEAMQEMVQIAAAANAAGIQVGEDRASEQIYNMGRELYAKRHQVGNAAALGFIGGKVLGAPHAIQSEMAGRQTDRLKGIADSAAPLAESGATIEPDTRTIAPSQEGPTPRLKPGEGAVRGPVESEPAIADAEQFLRDLETETPSVPGETATQAPETAGVVRDGPKIGDDRTTVPTFNDVSAILPRDKDGHPDFAPVFDALAATGKRSFNELTDQEKVALLQQIKGETPAAPKEAAQAAPAAAPEAVSAPEAATVAPETAAAPAAPQAAPRSLTEAIQQAAPQIEEAARAAVAGSIQELNTAAPAQPAIDDAIRSRFSEVLASKERRSNWAKAAGISEDQAQALIAEAVSDGRLTMRKGQPVRTPKARQAAPSPQAEVARAATSVPMGRAAEVRLERIQNDVAYKHAATILGAGTNTRQRNAALKKLADDKKATRAVLDEVHLALTGKPSKSMRKKGDVIEALRKADIAQAAPAPVAAPVVEEESVPLQDIVNPIDRNAPVEEQLRQIAELTAQSKPALDAQLKAMDAQIGTTSNSNIKKPETIVSKASRPSILATKPWHTIAHIRDTLRFQTKITSFDQIEKAAEFMLSQGYRIVKIDTAKMLQPKEWGWRFAGFDLRAPNGQLAEWYIIFDQMYVAKKKGHLLFEKWRNATEAERTEKQDEYEADIASSYRLYTDSFEAGLRNSGYSGLDDARADISRLSASLPEMAAKFSATSSASGGTYSPLGSQAPSAAGRNLEAPGSGSMTQQRPESRSSSTTGSSISDTSSINAGGSSIGIDNAADSRIQVAAAPPGDSYAIRTLQSINDPVVKGHYEALARSGTAVEPALGAIASDRRLDAGERQQLAELYVGEPVSGDPVEAIRSAAERRGNDLTSALLHGFSPEVSPSNLRVRDTLDTADIVRRLREMAERRLFGQDSLVIETALRVFDSAAGRLRFLEGAVVDQGGARRLGLDVDIAPLKKIMAVSLEYGPEAALKTFTHEEIHWLLEMGIIDPKGKEWAVLAGIAKRRPKKAEAIRILDKQLSEGKFDQETYDKLKSDAGKITYRQIYGIDQRYPHLRGDETRLVQETVAHAAADWAKGRQFAAPIERVFMRIRDFLEAIQNALNGLGFRSANDIFESIWAGDFVRKFEEAEARRAEGIEATREWMGENGVIAMAISAYHGSPHKFDRFSMDKIGTGEGAQAFGHGLYFAESEDVAVFYRGALSPKNDSEAMAQELAEQNGRVWSDMGAYERQSYIDEAQANPVDHQKSIGGHLYEVSIDAEPEQFLDYDKSLDEQSEFVRAAVNKALGGAVDKVEIRQVEAGWQVFVNGEAASVPYGRKQDAEARVKAGVRTNAADGVAVNRVFDIAKDPATVAKLRAAGIKGIRYLDQSSRGAGDGSRNLVVFDDSIVEIVGRDGKPVEPSNEPPIMAAFAGERAKTADQNALASAKEMDAAGESREDIWKQTGWFKGVDGRWRFEIDDSKSKLRAFGPDFSLLQVELTHEELFKAYPQMAEVEFNREGLRGYEGEFMPGGITPSRISISKGAKNRRSTVLHESQHGIQDIEGFAEGADLGTARRTPEYREEIDALKERSDWSFSDVNAINYSVYRRFAGEVESRTVQKRLSLTPEQRANRAPWLDYDVPESQQIVRMPDGSGQVMASVDLDMSETARLARAEAMGFDTGVTLYRGLMHPYRSDVAASRAQFFSTDPRIADQYAGSEYSYDGANIVPVYARHGRAAVIDAAGGDFYAIPGLASLGLKEGPMYSTDVVVREARKAGFDSVIIKNVKDGSVLSNGVSDVHIIFNPSNIRSVNATFDPAESDSPVLMASFRDWLPSRGPTPPQATEQGDSPGLNKIISDLKTSLGMTVNQGLWGTTLRQGKRTMRIRPPSNMTGQYDRDTGNISIRQSRDIKTLAHEGGHHLESLLGNELATLKAQHAQELAGRPLVSGSEISEAFADWFRSYVLDRAAAEKQAPNFAREFDDLLEAERPDLLIGLQEVSDQYQTYIQSAPLDQVTADMVTDYESGFVKEIMEHPNGVPDALMNTVSGWLSTSYSGLVDALHPIQQAVRRLLDIAERNGMVDADGKPLSLKDAADPYKIIRMFAGAYNRGRVWLEKGVSDLDTGKIIGPSLKDALEKALGGRTWSKKRFKEFNKYLVAIRAIEEYNALENRELTLAKHDSLLGRMGDARTTLSAKAQQEQATLARREDALARAQTILRDRRGMLRRVETSLTNTQERLDGLRDDLAQADADTAPRRRRSVQIAERDQQRLLREAEALVDEVAELDIEIGILEPEIAQRRDGVQRLRDQRTQLDAMEANIQRERKFTEARPKNDPTKEDKGTHERIINELGTPEFQEAAEMVHQFAFSLLTVQHQAGFWTDEAFAELSKRKDWYVPFQRDMSDVEGAAAKYAGSMAWTKAKKYKGSDRAIITPMAILSQDAYRTAQRIAFNNFVKALVQLSERVGPGGGAIAERLEREIGQLDPSQQNFDRLVEIGIRSGLNPIDAQMLAQRAELNLASKDIIKVLVSPENLGPGEKASFPLYEKGERITVRLPDAQLGYDMFNAINAIGMDNQDLWTSIFGKAANMLRVGVTTSFDFIGANIFRDMWAAWKVTGAAPILTHVRGARIMLGKGDVAGIPAADFQRGYNEIGGIAGGININAQSATQQRDVRDLLGTEIKFKSVVGGTIVGGAFGAGLVGALGGAAGLLLGGPVGGLVGLAAAKTTGFAVGGAIGGYMGRHGEVFKLVESAETAARLGVAAHAYKRAIAYDPSLSQSEAMFQAVFDTRDYLDWNRRGSKTFAVARAIPFWLSAVNGLTKTLQQGVAWGPRGSGVIRQAARTDSGKALKDVLERRLGIVWKHQTGDILSKDEEAELSESYKSYARWAGLTMITMMMILAGMSSMGDDEDDVRDEAKFRERYIRINGVDVRLPGVFELDMPAIALRIIYDAQNGGDDRWVRRLGRAAFELVAPPMGITAIDALTGVAFNSRIGGRPIVGPYLANKPPQDQFDAYTSQVSRDFSKAIANTGVPQWLIPPPKKLDHLLTTLGGSWGRDTMGFYEDAKRAADLNDGPAKKATDIPVVRRFTTDSARLSRSVQEFWHMTSSAGGEMTTAAAGYKDRVEGERPADADIWLSRLDKDQKVWALTQYHGSKSDKREHPLTRLDASMDAIRSVQDDIVLDRLAPKERQGRRKVRDFSQEIHLTPEKKREIVDILTRAQQIEARNTMILLERPGFKHMQIKDPKLIWDELKASSPLVYEHMQDVQQNKKIEDWPSVQREWPRYRERVLKQGVNAF